MRVPRRGLGWMLVAAAIGSWALGLGSLLTLHSPIWDWVFIAWAVSFVGILAAIAWYEGRHPGAGAGPTG